MPYRWSDSENVKTLMLWPHQSLTPVGFAWFIGATALLLTMPLLAVLGSPVAWVLLAFFFGVVWGVWHAIMANRRQRTMHEALSLTKEKVRLEHVPPKGPIKAWEADPFWVRVALRDDGPVENYLTLTGAGREVELGSFLSADERKILARELREALVASR